MKIDLKPSILARGLAQGIDEDRPLFEHWLKQLLAFPTISMQPEHRDAIKNCTTAAVNLMEELGAEAELLPPANPNGHPLAIGRFGHNPLHPTVLVYNHLDVQPIPEPEAWKYPPFVCTISEDHFYGRGSTDAKGPLLTTLLAARRARAEGVSLNILFVLDSELEIGSPHFEATLLAQKSKFRCDSILCSDTIWTSREQPVISGGIRGVISFLVRLRTAERIAHAGWAGGYARNPLAEVVSAIAEAVDGASGQVKIPGFYDDVLPPTAEELEGFAACGFVAEVFNKEHGLLSARSSDPLDSAQRMWALPTLELHGISGGFTGPGNRMIVPDAVEAKLSCRLVPGMSAEATFEKVRSFMQTKLPDAEIVFLQGVEPLRAEVEGPLAEAAKASMDFGFGRAALIVREGVTIPALAALTQHLAAPIVLMPLSLSDQSYHGSNECFEWYQASGGIMAYSEYFRRLGSLAASPRKL